MGWERTEPSRVSVLVMLVDGGDGGWVAAKARHPCTMHDHSLSCAPHASTGAYTAALLGSVA